jgi:exodeoxyribonuclease VII large subunit
MEDRLMNGSDEVLSVTQLTRAIRMLLEEHVGTVWVEGEVSNLRRQASGHLYFTLKDEGAQLSCVLFRGNAARSAVRLADGVAVRLQGDLSVYEPRGNYQMVVRQVQAQGLGSLQARFEALKARLHEEGLFDLEHKQAIPTFPRVVALVTSPTGAAIRDMLNILGRRAPWVRVLVFPVRVQGQGAEREIAAAVRRLNDPEGLGIPRPDTIVVGRGGGSLEDLWNFNEEVVARAIFDSVIPVISAVGHEIDFTIADLVADMRAPTPSAAAELLAPEAGELLRQFETIRRRLASRVEALLERQTQALRLAQRGSLAHEPQRCLMEAEQTVDEMEGRLREAARDWLQGIKERCQDCGQRLERLHPVRLLSDTEYRMALLAQRLQQGMRRRLEQIGEAIQSREGNLRMLGPQSVLARGFSYTLNAQGKVIRSADEVVAGEVIHTHLERGVLQSVVKGPVEE